MLPFGQLVQYPLIDQLRLEVLVNPCHLYFPVDPLVQQLRMRRGDLVVRCLHKDQQHLSVLSHPVVPAVLDCRLALLAQPAQ